MRILLLLVLQFFSISIFALNYTVDQTGDAGIGSGLNGDLRYCVSNANSGDVINFNITTGTAPYVITLNSDLVTTSDITIDGASQSGYIAGGAPVISISGSTAGYGLIFSNVGGYAYLNAIHFNNQGGTAITLDGGGVTNITGCYIGTDISGKNYSALPPDTGIHVINGASASIGQGSANPANFILSPNGIIVNSPTSYSYIYYNYIGLAMNGLKPGGTKKTLKGIEIVNGSGSIVGNQIGNCDSAAIVLGANSTYVVNVNTIGKDLSSIAVPNGRGVWVKGSNNNISSNTIVNSAVISGSSGIGIEVSGAGAINNNIYQNIYSCNQGGGIVFNGGSPSIATPIINVAASYFVYPNGTSSMTGTGPIGGTIEFYAVDATCGTVPLQGAYITTATVDGAGNWNALSSAGFTKGTKIIAIAISAAKDISSVFSNSVDLVAFDCKTNVKAITGSSNVTACNKNPIYLSGSVVNAADGNWTSSGTGTFSMGTNVYASFVNYAPSDGDITAGSVKLTLVTIGAIGACPDTFSSFTISLPIPLAKIYDGTSSVHACQSAGIPLDAKLYNSTSGVVWSTTGSGTFSPNVNTLKATYNPTAVELSAQATINLTLTPNIQGACTPIPQTITMTFDNPSDPTVSIGNGKVANLLQCSTDPYVYLNDTSSTGMSVVKTWIRTNGSAIKDTSFYSGGPSYYAATVSELTNGITLIFQGASPGCKLAQDTINVNFVSDPTSVFAGDTLTYCGNITSITLSQAKVTSTVPYNITWSGENNDGLIYGAYSNATVLNPVFTPSSLGKSYGGITLTMRAREKTATCPGISDDVKIVFLPAPVISAGADLTVCQGDTIPLNGNVSGGFPHKWSSAGNGQFSNSSALNTNYIPSSSDFKKVAFNLILSANNQGCTSRDELLIILIPRPDVGVGSKQTICPETSVNLVAAIGTDQIGLWTIKDGTGKFSDSTKSNVTITDITAAQNSYIWTITDTATHCSNTAIYEIDYCFAPPLKVYNALSPNGDGIGESLHILNIGFYGKNKVSVFNRWGEVVFKVDNYENLKKDDISGLEIEGTGNAFTGKSNVGTVQELPNGSYYYLIDKGVDGEKSEKGFLVIQK